MGIKQDSLLALSEPTGDSFIDDLAYKVNMGVITLEDMREAMKERLKQTGV
jgi:hypothetical protein